jgi:hypothetical protein
MMTNGLLHSTLHRVVLPRDKAMTTRHSFAAGGGTYATPLIRIRTPLIPPREQASRILTSGKWLDKKFGMLRAKRHDSEQAWALRGPQRVAVMLRLR